MSVSVDASKGFSPFADQTFKSLQDATKSGTGTLLSDGEGGVVVGGNDDALVGDWAMVGDSITASGSGWNSSGDEIYGGRYSPGWGLATALMLANKGGFQFARNFGFGGKGCEYLLSQLGLITDGTWKNYIVQIGTNDVDAADIEPALTAYQSLLSGLLASGARSIVCVAIPPKFSITVGEWNRRQWIICQALKIPFINPYTALETSTTGLPIVSKYEETTDVVHPSANTMLIDVVTALQNSPVIPKSYPRPHSIGMENLIANGFFQTGSSLGAGWGEATSTYSIEAYSGTLPVHGRIQVLYPLDASVTSYVLKQNAFVVEPGSEYELVFYAKIVKLRRDAWSVNIADGPSAAGTVISRMGIFASTASPTTSQTFEGFFAIRFVAIQETASLLLAHTLTAGDAMSSKYGNFVLRKI